MQRLTFSSQREVSVIVIDTDGCQDAGVLGTSSNKQTLTFRFILVLEWFFFPLFDKRRH